LPIAASGRAGLAAVYLAQMLALPAVVHAGRRLGESPRFVAHAHERHSYRELLRAPYPRRLLMVGGSALLGATFFVPVAEFFNRYLDDVHGFSAFEIVAFLVITGAPSFLMLLLGGRLADLRGRKVVGVPLAAAAALAFAGFYLTGPPWIWLLAFAGNMLGSAGGAALAPYRSELFPTRVRAGAYTVIVAATVVGSAIGLTVAGQLAGSLGVGRAIATLAVPALLGVAIVGLWFPETARRELEETSADTMVAHVPIV
jgi:predicted MFS family arabinose efflux permease